MESDAAPVTLSTDKLNVTIAKRSSEKLADAPIQCNTSTTPVLAQLPPSLSNATNTTGKSIGAVLWTSPVSLHSGGLTDSNSSLSGPMVSFKLRADGETLPISGLSDSIRLSLPVKAEEKLAASCVGQPSANAMVQR
eukprot:5915176-Prymnesium_polylepis.1